MGAKVPKSTLNSSFVISMMDFKVEKFAVKLNGLESSQSPFSISCLSNFVVYCRKFVGTRIEFYSFPLFPRIGRILELVIFIGYIWKRIIQIYRQQRRFVIFGGIQFYSRRIISREIARSTAHQKTESAHLQD